MARLRDGDYRAVLDFVGEINDAQDVGELWAMVLPSLRRLVPADYASYNEVPSDGAAPFAIAEPDVPAAAVAAWEQLAPTNPSRCSCTGSAAPRAARWSSSNRPAAC